MLLGKMKYVLPVFLSVLSIFSFNSNGYAGPKGDEARREFREGYQNAKDKSAFLVRSAKELALHGGDTEKDRATAEEVIRKMKRKSMGIKHPEYLTALNELESNKDKWIAQKATIIREKIEDRIKYLDFEQGLKEASDKMAFLHDQADSDSDWVLLGLAVQLGKLDDPRSIAILKKIEKHKAKNIWDEDDGYLYEFSPAREAEMSLAKIEARATLKGLDSEGTPLSEKERLVRQYAMVNKPAFREKIQKFLWDIVAQKPEFAVPLMVEFEAQYMASEKMILDQYPHLIDEGLDRCLESSNDSQVAACIVFVNEANIEKYFGKIFDMVFNEKGNLDYSGIKPNKYSRYQAMNIFGVHKYASISYLEKLLYVSDKYSNEKKDGLYIISSLNNKDSVEILNRFLLSGSDILGKKIDSSSTFREVAIDLIRESKVSK